MNVNLFEPFARAMSQTPQPSRYHGEGDVLVHTQMVCEKLQLLPEFRSLDERRQFILMAAAQLHDIGKIPATTELMGEIEAPHHAPIGSRMARKHLYLNHLMGGSDDQMHLREAICLLIRYHSFPAHAINMPHGILALHRIASNSLLVKDFSIKMLCILAKADMMGRICDDRQELLDRITLCEELARDEHCFDGCYPFKSDVTRHAFLQGRDVCKDQELHDDTWGTVYMMSGLPGVGKDTWIRRNLIDIPMVSLDEIRIQLGISPTANQGSVANFAKEQAKNFLRRHQSFVWNATNITQQTRQQLINLFEDYKARVKIVYLETAPATQALRNASREAVVPQSAIDLMLSKLTLPEMFEARELEWITT